MLLLLLSWVSRVRLCVTPQTAAHQAPLSPGFSRQEHWSGLPLPSPMHESEKWKWSRSVMSDSATPWAASYQAPLSMGFSRQEYWSGVPLPSLQSWNPIKTLYQSFKPFGLPEVLFTQDWLLRRHKSSRCLGMCACESWIPTCAEENILNWNQLTLWL